MNLAVSAATDLGLRRTENEDTAAYWIPEDPARHDRGVLLVVADGMGGSSAGEIASHLTVETVLDAIRDGEFDGDHPEDDLYHAVLAANHLVHQRSIQDSNLHGMGTTCTAAIIRDRAVYFAHVGDSRAYLVRGGEMRQITDDHSLVQQLVQARQLTPEEARVDPRRNVVTRSVGVSSEVDVDYGRVDTPLADGDTLLLCTDGLHGLVEDAELAKLASNERLDDACRDLIELARSRGGYDNITVILARLGQAVAASPAGLWHAPDRELPAPVLEASTGTIVALHLSTASRAPLNRVERVHVIEGRGLEGDRHAREGHHRQVLLVEEEVLDRFGLPPGAVREQITVRGLRLGMLREGQRLRVGSAVLEVAGPCRPCARMDEIRQGLRLALEGQRGRFARVLQSGEFSVGDTLTVDS